MNTIIITAAGKGTRMQSDRPKQFIELGKKPILMRTMEAFFEFNPDIRMILVLPENQIAYWNSLCKKHAFYADYQIVAGGNSRFQSVKNGLAAAPDEGLIGIHDGVRPFIRPDTIRRIYHEAGKQGNAIPAIPPAETIRIAEEDHNYQVDRSTVRLIQTPQVFKAKKLKEAYQCDYNPAFTDDASVYEAAGNKINIVEGQVGNIKITTSSDLPLQHREGRGEVTAETNPS